LKGASGAEISKSIDKNKDLMIISMFGNVQNAVIKIVFHLQIFMSPKRISGGRTNGDPCPNTGGKI